MKRLIALLLIMQITAPAWSAVAYISDADKTDVLSGNDAFTSFTVSGTNPVILIVAGLDSAAGTVSSVVLSAGLTSGTPYLVKAQRNGTAQLEIWAIPAPTGTGTITVSYSVSVNHQCNAILMQGADQTTPAIIAEAVSATSASSPLGLTPSNLTANDAAVYSCGVVSGDGPNASSGVQTFIGNLTTMNMAAGYRIGTGALSCTYSSSASNAMVGIRVQAPSSGIVTKQSILGSNIISGGSF